MTDSKQLPQVIFFLNPLTSDIFVIVYPQYLSINIYYIKECYKNTVNTQMKRMTMAHKETKPHQNLSHSHDLTLQSTHLHDQGKRIDGRYRFCSLFLLLGKDEIKLKPTFG